MTKKAVLPDIMTEVDERGVFIDKVGIRKVRIPFKVKMRNNTVQNTTAEISCYIGLHNTAKGTHMSRFSEIISKYVDMSDEELVDIATESMKHSCADLMVANCLEWSQERAYIIQEGRAPMNILRDNLPEQLESILT